MKKFKKGSVESFDENWRRRPESFYNHFSTKPSNQIQFAFKNHYEIFNKLIFNKKKVYEVLEVGCGRGSLSSFFAHSGHKCTLLDISSEVIEIAKKIFKQNNHNANFVIGDVENINFKDNSYDVVFSIGLMEHFKKIEKSIQEQLRVLRPGGTLFLYVVPKYKENIQSDYNWVNEILKTFHSSKSLVQKEKVYRSDENSTKYIEFLTDKVSDVFSAGIYPLPMISPSIEFPFTLMSDQQEKILINHFKKILTSKEGESDHPWLCEEGYGQAFLVWARK